MKEVCEQIVGHDEHEPIVTEILRPYKFRVVERDGAKYPVTRDIKRERVNLVITEGIITEAYIG